MEEYKLLKEERKEAAQNQCQSLGSVRSPARASGMGSMGSARAGSGPSPPAAPPEAPWVLLWEAELSLTAR